MKKVIIHLLTLSLLLIFNPFESQATTTTTPDSIHVTTGDPTPEAAALLDRLAEIEAMDKSNLSAREKKALRKEVRAIKKGLGESSGGVYLSAGAIILIIVLLIVFL